MGLCDLRPASGFSIAAGAMTANYTFDYNLANQVSSKTVSDLSLIYGYGASYPVHQFLP